MKSYKPSVEWLKQSEYDMGTAVDMFKSARYIYTIFMCHLSIEKALKSIFTKAYQDNPPRTHGLIYLVSKIKEKVDFQIPENYFNMIQQLDKVSIPVRYPESLSELSKNYSKENTYTLLINSKELLQWMKQALS